MNRAVARFLCVATPLALIAVGTRADNQARPPKSQDWPDNRSGRWVRAYFDSINSGAEATLRQFVTSHYSEKGLQNRPVKERVQRLVMLGEQLGKLEVTSVTANGPNDLTVIVFCKNVSTWFKFTFLFEGHAKDEVVHVKGMPTAPPGADLEGAVYDTSASLTDLAERVRRDSRSPALVIVVARGGRIIDRAAVGVRSVTDRVPVTPSDSFHLGSITKAYTATMIARLVEQGRIEWTSTPGELLTDIPMREEYRNVTMNMLLQHRGGMGSIPDPDALRSATREGAAPSPGDGRRAVAALALKAEPIAKPGERFIYSNAGYVVAAVMAEQATGRSWERLLHDEVVVPLGLKETGLGWPASADRPREPRGHYGLPPKLRVQRYDEHGLFDIDLAVYVAPAGHIRATMGDLAKFGLFHLQGLRGSDAALSSKTLKYLHTPSFAGQSDRSYAFGWMLQKDPSGATYHWHGGSAGTFYASVRIYPESDLVLAAAANMGIPAQPFVEKLFDSLREKYAPARK